MNAEESFANIFGKCSFAALIKKLDNAVHVRNWPDEWSHIRLLALTKAKGSTFSDNVFKYFFGAIVYQIWMKRNARVFSRIRRNENQIWSDIAFDSISLIHSIMKKSGKLQLIRRDDCRVTECSKAH